jgi:hypothetical protein
MPYHVEIRRSRRRARVFNLSEEELRRTVLDLWRLGQPVELGDRRWRRDDSQLRILDGPPLEGVDLAYGQGWNRAERTARDVTDELVADGAGVVAVLACTPEAADAAARMLAALGLDSIPWIGAARDAILAWLAAGEQRAPLEFSAVLLVSAADPPARWLFEAGVALGSLGPRAVLIALDGEPPPTSLDGIDVLALDPEAEGDLDRLAERLRRAGLRR